MSYTGNISDIYVPNYYASNARILFIGESPGEDEEKLLTPFVGPSGSLLRDTITSNGLDDKQCSFANLSNHRPLHNVFHYLRGSNAISKGQEEIENYIRRNPPNVIVPLGDEALFFTTGGLHKKSGTWRGSIIESKFRRDDGTAIKCIPTYHPARVIREQTLIPSFDLDIKRIISDSNFSEFNYTKREYIINPTGVELETLVERFSKEPSLAVDIESTKKTARIICVGFAVNPNLAITIFPDSIHQVACINKLLSSPSKKIFHFGFYDYLMLRLYGYEVNNYDFDTYIAQHTLNAGQPNTLAHLSSIYTREPYYKQEGRAELPSDSKVWAEKSDKNEVGIYNCKDCCVTYEIAQAQKVELEEEKLTGIFEQEIGFIPWLTRMSEAGMLVDRERHELFQKALLVRWKQLNDAIDFLCRTPVNVRSPKLKDILYKDLSLPERKKRDKKTGKWNVTTDEDALVATIAWCKGKMDESKKPDTKSYYEKRLLIVQSIREIRGLAKMASSYVSIKLSVDNRIRSMFKIGPETGRLAANKFVDHTGLNAQTYPRDPITIPDNLDIDLSTIIAQMKLEKEDEDDIFETVTEEEVV